MKPKKRSKGRKPERTMHLDEWLASFKAQVANTTAAGEDVGACWLADPQTGDNVCVLMDEKSCTAAGGTFIGGPCGG
jgi:hypothetical protein